MADADTMFYSSLARSLQTAAFARPVAAKRAFQPIKTNFAPSLSARFASTDSTKDGRIHQVIGAVVDGISAHEPLERNTWVSLEKC